jgi:CRP/FNR family transcriptional regulator, cyclic AMP receptor protein
VSFFDYPGEQSPAEPPARLLAEATDEEWAEVLKHAHYRQFRPGETVVTDGAREQSLYLVIEGELEVLVPRRRGHRRIATISDGSVIGELSFFDGAPRSALVRALTPALLAELSPSEFDALADANPSLARQLLFDLGRILAQRLRAAHDASAAGAN